MSTFGSKGIEKMATEIYFSSKLRYLSLKEVSAEVITGVNVVDKFASLVILVSRTVFLSLSGMVVPEEEGRLFEGELSVCSP